MTRRTILAAPAWALAAQTLTAAPAQQAATPAQTPTQQAAAPAIPRIELALVNEFVAKGHQPNPEILRALLDKEPGLLNSAWDWGNGDWETSLGAAAHTGQRETALFLLGRGARPDLFAAAMLGELSTVKGWLAFAPAAHQSPGPHGIPLLSHALVGLKPAAPVFELLLERGANVNAVSNNGMTPLMVASSGGQADAVAALLARGADPKAKAKDGRTAFSIASKAGREQVLKVLAGAGVSE